MRHPSSSLAAGSPSIRRSRFRSRYAPVFAIALAAVLLAIPSWAEDSKPNILVLWGDDIGISNISAYSDGLMGYETPNIDRIANEGLRFLHYHG